MTLPLTPARTATCPRMRLYDESLSSTSGWNRGLPHLHDWRSAKEQKRGRSHVSHLVKVALKPPRRPSPIPARNLSGPHILPPNCRCPPSTFRHPHDCMRPGSSRVLRPRRKFSREMSLAGRYRCVVIDTRFQDSIERQFVCCQVGKWVGRSRDLSGDLPTLAFSLRLHVALHFLFLFKFSCPFQFSPSTYSTFFTFPTFLSSRPNFELPEPLIQTQYSR